MAWWHNTDAVQRLRKNWDIDRKGITYLNRGKYPLPQRVM
jgi:hypothetical protein